LLFKSAMTISFAEQPLTILSYQFVLVTPMVWIVGGLLPRGILHVPEDIAQGRPLAAADVGIAMGTGTDIAMESAQITLVREDLMGIGQGFWRDRNAQVMVFQPAEFYPRRQCRQAFRKAGSAGVSK
jgi:hypothetical protein